MSHTYYFVPFSELDAKKGLPFYKEKGIPKICRETNPRHNNFPIYGTEDCVILSLRVGLEDVTGTFLEGYSAKTRVEADVILATDEWKYIDPVGG